MPKPKFDQLIKEIENIVSKLEGGEVSLEESLELYKVGSEKIKEAQLRLQKLEHEFEKIKVE